MNDVYTEMLPAEDAHIPVQDALEYVQCPGFPEHSMYAITQKAQVKWMTGLSHHEVHEEHESKKTNLHYFSSLPS